MCVNASSTITYGQVDLKANVSLLSEQLFPFPPLAELIPIGVFYAGVFVTGLLGNLAVLLVVCSARQDSPLDNCLISLSVSDLCVILFCVPIRCARWFSYTWVYGAFLCKAVHYVQTVSMAASVYTITAIALARYRATFDSLHIRSSKSQKRMRQMLISCWIFAVIFASPTLYVQGLHQVFQSSDYHWCMKSFALQGMDFAAIAYEAYLFVMLFVVPLCGITFAYSRISRLLRQRSITVTHDSDKNPSRTVQSTLQSAEVASISKRTVVQQLNVTDTQSTQTAHRPSAMLMHVGGLQTERVKNKSIIRLLLATVIAFVVFHAPAQMDNIMQAFGVLPRFNPQPIKIVRMLTSLLASANASANPFVYCFVSAKFRERMNDSLASLIGSKKFKPRNLVSNASRLTRGFSQHMRRLSPWRRTMTANTIKSETKATTCTSEVQRDSSMIDSTL